MDIHHQPQHLASKRASGSCLSKYGGPLGTVRRSTPSSGRKLGRRSDTTRVHIFLAFLCLSVCVFSLVFERVYMSGRDDNGVV